MCEGSNKTDTGQLIDLHYVNYGGKVERGMKNGSHFCTVLPGRSPVKLCDDLETTVLASGDTASVTECVFGLFLPHFEILSRPMSSLVVAFCHLSHILESEPLFCV